MNLSTLQPVPDVTVSQGNGNSESVLFTERQLTALRSVEFNGTMAPDAVKEFIREHCREEHALAEGQGRRPEEVCGFVVAKGAKQQMIRARNIGQLPHYVAHPRDTAAAEDVGEIILSYHSHPLTGPTPTDPDKANAEKNKTPVLIVSWPTDTWEVYTPTGWRAELVGRPFVYGVFDCYTLLQDHHQERLGVVLPDFGHAEQPFWWKHGGNLYMDHFEEAGFRRVSDLKPHDVILCTLDSAVPNHCAVYLGDGHILHHVQDRISKEQPYVIDSGFYAKLTYGIYRHSTNDTKEVAIS